MGCVLSAFLGLVIDILNELISHATATNTNTFFNVLSTSLGVVAIGLGLSAQSAQLRRWNRNTRQRIMIGLPIAMLTLVAVIPNFFEKPDLGDLLNNIPKTPTAPSSPVSPAPAADARKTVGSPVPPAPADARKTDDSLVKPGWYGELQHDGLLVIVSSYEENASESRRFNSRLPKPVSYATFTVINLGNATPTVINNLQVSARLASGETVQSLPVRPLLDLNAASNSDLLKRLALPQQLAIGGMFPDVPICMPADFLWSRVLTVTVTLGVQEIAVPGRVMTADEKKAMVNKIKSSRPSTNSTGSAETWFKNL